MKRSVVVLERASASQAQFSSKAEQTSSIVPAANLNRGNPDLAAATQLPAGCDICEAGDVADCLWVLHEGSVAAVDASGYESDVTIAPALLGETALLRELGDEYHFRPCALR